MPAHTPLLARSQRTLCRGVPCPLPPQAAGVTPPANPPGEPRRWWLPASRVALIRIPWRAPPLATNGSRRTLALPRYVAPHRPDLASRGLSSRWPRSRYQHRFPSVRSFVRRAPLLPPALERDGRRKAAD